MSSGWQQMIINTQERAVSTDINRLQRFKERDMAEIFRYLMDVIGGNDDDTAGAVITEPNFTETPLRAEIINGLLVRPQVGATVLDILVDPGIIFAMLPTLEPDISNYKMIHDAGINATGILVMTPNFSGSTRIDVIEAQVNPTDIVTNDNRDIFNPVTGLFTATSVPKVRMGQLQYRIRLGTPGGGYPGAAVGWLPLCIASVPNTAAGNDVITFWDVRPLINDRQFQYNNLGQLYPTHIRSIYRTQDNNRQTNQQLAGFAEAYLNGRRIGGTLRRGTPGTDHPYLECGPSVLDNFEGGAIAPPANTMVSLYFVFPFGLPRWARYTDFSFGQRVPRSPRGIPVLSRQEPNDDGTPSTPIALPTTTGLGGTATIGYAFSAQVDAVGDGKFAPVVAYGNRIYVDGLYESTLAAVNTNAKTVFQITPGLNYPGHAKRLLTEWDILANTGGAITFYTRNSVTAGEVGLPNVTDLNGGTDEAPATGNWSFLPNVVLIATRQWVTLVPTIPTGGPGAIMELTNNNGFAGAGPPVIQPGSFFAIHGFEL